MTPTLRQSYFKAEINKYIKYLHKQSTYSMLSTKIKKSLSDRPSPVMHQTADNNY